MPARAAPAPAIGSQSTILLPGAAQCGVEGAEWALKPLVMPPAPGKGSIPGRGTLGRLAALMPGMSMPSPPGPLLLSDPLSGPFPAAMHQPSCSQGSSPLLKANYKGTVPQPPNQFLCQSSCPPAPARAVSKGQGRDAITAAKRTRTLETGAIPPP